MSSFVPELFYEPDFMCARARVCVFPAACAVALIMCVGGGGRGRRLCVLLQGYNRVQAGPLVHQEMSKILRDTIKEV